MHWERKRNKSRKSLGEKRMRTRAAIAPWQEMDMRFGLGGQGNKHHHSIQKAYSAISKVNISKPSYQASVESRKHPIFPQQKGLSPFYLHLAATLLHHEMIFPIFWKHLPWSSICLSRQSTTLWETVVKCQSVLAYMHISLFQDSPDEKLFLKLTHKWLVGVTEKIACYNCPCIQPQNWVT